MGDHGMFLKRETGSKSILVSNFLGQQRKLQDYKAVWFKLTNFISDDYENIPISSPTVGRWGNDLPH